MVRGHHPQYVCDWKIVNAWADKCDRLTAERDGLKADGLALLARLEAAEEYCKIQGPSTLGAEKAYKAWRKAASEMRSGKQPGEIEMMLS